MRLAKKLEILKPKEEPFDIPDEPVEVKPDQPK